MQQEPLNKHLATHVSSILGAPARVTNDCAMSGADVEDFEDGDSEAQQDLQDPALCIQEHFLTFNVMQSPMSHTPLSASPQAPRALAQPLSPKQSPPPIFQPPPHPELQPLSPPSPSSPSLLPTAEIQREVAPLRDAPPSPTMSTSLPPQHMSQPPHVQSVPFRLNHESISPVTKPSSPSYHPCPWLELAAAASVSPTCLAHLKQTALVVSTVQAVPCPSLRDSSTDAGLAQDEQEVAEQPHGMMALEGEGQCTQVHREQHSGLMCEGEERPFSTVVSQNLLLQPVTSSKKQPVHSSETSVEQLRLACEQAVCACITRGPVDRPTASQQQAEQYVAVSDTVQQPADKFCVVQDSTSMLARDPSTLIPTSSSTHTPVNCTPRAAAIWEHDAREAAQFSNLSHDPDSAGGVAVTVVNNNAFVSSRLAVVITNAAALASASESALTTSQCLDHVHILSLAVNNEIRVDAAPAHVSSIADAAQYLAYNLPAQRVELPPCSPTQGARLCDIAAAAAVAIPCSPTATLSALSETQSQVRDRGDKASWMLDRVGLAFDQLVFWYFGNVSTLASLYEFAMLDCGSQYICKISVISQGMCH